MRKRHQVRFTSEDQILTLIDKSKEQALLNLKIACECDETRKLHYVKLHALEEEAKLAESGRREEKIRQEIFRLEQTCEELKARAERLSRQRHRIENTKLPKLSVALAQFRTQLMEPITTDPAVVLA